jgi:hypothetical protein
MYLSLTEKETIMERRLVNERKLPSDLEFIADPDRWPNWPFLPLKKPQPEGPPECVLCVRVAEGWAIFRANLFMLVRVAEGWAIFRANLFMLPEPEEFKAAWIKTYASAEEVVADGWVVD